MATPHIVIDFDPKGNLQVGTNLDNKAIIIGLLEQAKFLVMSRPMEPPPLVKPVNGQMARILNP